MSNHHILVVGGGITGMTAACLLARSGLSVTLVESGRPVRYDAAHIGRVSALNMASQKLLDAIGVWQPLVENGAYPYRHMRVWDSHSEAQIDFDAQLCMLPALGHIVENDLVVSAMQDKLAHNYNVTIHYESEIRAIDYIDNAVVATVDTTTGSRSIEATLAIAADGASSTLRHLADIDVHREDFHQHAIVANIRCEKSHQETAWQCFTPTGPVALLPLSGNQCSLVYSCDNDSLDQLLSSDNKALIERLNALFSHAMGNITLANSPRTFSLQNQHASRYIGDRIALIGDAAHTTHPLAGLGANIGLLDAAALCELVGEAAAAGKPAHGRTLLRRYERWRRGDNAAVLLAMKTFKSVFGSTNPALTRMRQSGFSFADQLTPIKSQLADYAIGTRGDLPAVCR